MMDAMPEEKKDKPKVMLDAVVEEVQPVVAAATVEQLVNVPEVTMPVEVTKVESGGGRMGWVTAVLALLVGVAVGAGAGDMIWGTRKEAVTVKPAVTAEPTKSEASMSVLSPTPTVAVKRSALSVQVLNGSGLSGAAGKVKDLLESLGYVNVSTGNADRNDYEGLSVAAKKGSDAVWEIIKSDLGSKYDVSSEKGVLDEDSQFSAVITLGN